MLSYCRADASSEAASRGLANQEQALELLNSIPLANYQRARGWQELTDWQWSQPGAAQLEIAAAHALDVDPERVKLKGDPSRGYDQVDHLRGTELEEYLAYRPQAHTRAFGLAFDNSMAVPSHFEGK